MTAKTIYYLITVLELYIFSVGACIYIMRYETLSPKAAKLYKIIISVDIILSSLFLIKYFTMDNKNVHNYVSTSLDITIVIWILEVIIIAFKGINLFYCNGAEGISLMACDTSQIILSITINRKTVKGKYTDMAWYLQNIIYKFLDIDVRLLSYKIEEYED